MAQQGDGEFETEFYSDETVWCCGLRSRSGLIHSSVIVRIIGYRCGLRSRTATEPGVLQSLNNC